MRIWRLIRNLNIGQFLRLARLCIQNLNKIRPTWAATNMSVSLADKYFGKLHRKNTAGNAFRHALWNYLIAKRCLGSEKELEEILDWTEEITAMHEDLFPNDPLARAMDLHNNKVGRYIFQKNSDRLEEDMIRVILKLSGQSVMISSTEELKHLSEDQMAHIENINQR